jgi:CyaY protein
MDEQQYQTESGNAIAGLNKRLVAAADRYGFDVDFNAGALTVEFEDPPAKFVVSPNAPVKQIWVSALTKSFKLEWDAVRNAFVLPETAQDLVSLMADVIGRQLGESVEL